MGRQPQPRALPDKHPRKARKFVAKLRLFPCFRSPPRFQQTTPTAQPPKNISNPTCKDNGKPTRKHRVLALCSPDGPLPRERHLVLHLPRTEHHGVRPLLRRYTDPQLAQETAFLAHPVPEQPDAGPSPGEETGPSQGVLARTLGLTAARAEFGEGRGRGDRGGKRQGMEVGKRELLGRRLGWT